MNQITVQTPTPSIIETKSFYEKLGFRSLNGVDRAIYTDGKAIIEIDDNRFARTGFRLYQYSWSNIIDLLKVSQTVVEIPEGYMTTDPNGIWIHLIESDIIYEVKEESGYSLLGNFAGVSIETISMENSYHFYKMFGFHITAGAIDNSWMTLSHASGFSISFMKPLSCPHLFFNPSLTYFNGSSNLAIIQSIRTLGIPITEEITYFNKDGLADNIIIRDPGGLGFFIFND